MIRTSVHPSERFPLRGIHLNGMTNHPQASFSHRRRRVLGLFRKTDQRVILIG